jgi:hypothetical protein
MASQHSSATKFTAVPSGPHAEAGNEREERKRKRKIRIRKKIKSKIKSKSKIG